MNATLKFDWALYLFPDPMTLGEIIDWLNEREVFAKQMEMENPSHETFIPTP